MGTHPHPKGHSPSPIFGHVCCGKTAGWIKIPLGGEIDLDIVLNGDPAPYKGAQPPIFGPCLLWPSGGRHCVRWGPSSPSPNGSTAAPIFGPCIVAKWLDGSRCYLVRSRPRPCPHCVKWVPLQPSPSKGHSPQFSAHVRCGQRAGWIKMPLGT